MRYSQISVLSDANGCMLALGVLENSMTEVREMYGFDAIIHKHLSALACVDASIETTLISQDI